MKNRQLRIAVMIPVLGISLSVVRAEIDRSGRTWRVPIEGYDPRDLLHGRYLRYRYVLDLPPTPGPWEPVASDPMIDPMIEAPPTPVSPDGSREPTHWDGTEPQAECICLERDNPEGYDPPAEWIECGRVDRCAGWLDASALAPPLRFFIPEAEAAALERALRDRSASIVIAIDAEGGAMAKELWIDDMPWRGALAR